ncbi:uncharacterized protein LOC108474078 [Gossypium arboreum]|uniref:uncharacterized protein LOC108474078 n=1 Tax=Gossypium arboreum TaxID=29729 RepID=UPI0008196171|nr:uncharacterized protein LOC108474078 [Gossypium arboreum]
MLRILERVAGPNTGNGSRGSISERLRSNGAEIFKDIAEVAPNVAEYWLEATKRIMDDLDCTFEQKLKGAMSLLQEEAYKWWLTVKEGTQPDRITWEFFKSTFQGTYVGESYVDARRKEFLNLTQGDRSVVECEAEFLRLNQYSKGIVAIDYERYVRFKDDLKDSLRVLIASQREWDFAALVEKEKIAEYVKRIEHLNRERERGKNKRDFEPSNSDQRPKRRAKVDGPVRAGPIVATTGLPPCVICGKGHARECCRRTGACLSCSSIEHHLGECPGRLDQRQVFGRGNVQPSRGRQQPPRGCGQASGGNSLRHGVLERGANHTEVRQPALVGKYWYVLYPQYVIYLV